MPHPLTPASVTDIVSLGDSLTALTQSLQPEAARQGSALYFDYVGLTLFPANDVAALKQCVEEMVAAGIAQAASGSGSLFLSVYAWPLSVDKARVTVQLAHTDSVGTRDLGKLSSMFGELTSAATCESKDMPHINTANLSAMFGDGADAACACHVSRGEGAVIVLSLTLPHGGSEVEPAYLLELATVSAWLIGSSSEEELLLATRLQRDGWLVRQFRDVDADDGAVGSGAPKMSP